MTHCTLHVATYDTVYTVAAHIVTQCTLAVATHSDTVYTVHSYT